MPALNADKGHFMWMDSVSGRLNSPVHVYIWPSEPGLKKSKVMVPGSYVFPCLG